MGGISAITQLLYAPAVDVRTFGAKCDGVTDDTVAVAAAMASLPDSSASTFYYSAGGGTLLFPPGLCKASIQMRSSIKLKGMGPGAAILATGAGATIVGTIQGSFWIFIEDLDIQIDQKANVVALDIAAAQRGDINNVNIGGGVTGMTTGIGLLIRGTVVSQTAYIHFRNFVVDIGPATAWAVDGYNATFDFNDAKAVTWCSWTNCRFTNCDNTKAIVDLRKWCDTNQMTNVDIVCAPAPAAASVAGIVVNSDTPGTQMDVNGWWCINLVFEGNFTTAIQFAACQSWRIYGLSVLGAANLFTKTALTEDCIIKDIYNGAAYFNSTIPLQLGFTDKPTALAIPPFTTTLANGANNNVDATNKSCLIVIGPTGSFSITGFAGGVNGQELDVFCDAAFACTIVHNSGSSSAGNRISTILGTDIVGGVHVSHFTFKYYSVVSVWVLTSYNA